MPIKYFFFTYFYIKRSDDILYWYLVSVFCNQCIQNTEKHIYNANTAIQMQEITATILSEFGLKQSASRHKDKVYLNIQQAINTFIIQWTLFWATSFQ